ncbi:MAG: TetR family transcriptional regulator [Hyphomicrobiaceae bacterium]
MIKPRKTVEREARLPRVSRIERKRAERTDAVLRASAQLFAQKGYEGTNLEEIAARLDLRGPSLYYYVSTKEELFSRCIETTAAGVFKRLRAVASRPLPPLERLRLLFREQVLLQVRDYPEFGPLFLKVQVPDERLRRRMRELGRRQLRLFRNVLEEAAAGGDAAREASSVRMLLAFGAMAHLQEWYEPGGEIKPDQLADEVAAILLSLVAPTETRSESESRQDAPVHAVPAAPGAPRPSSPRRRL